MVRSFEQALRCHSFFQTGAGERHRFRAPGTSVAQGFLSTSMRVRATSLGLV